MCELKNQTRRQLPRVAAFFGVTRTGCDVNLMHHLRLIWLMFHFSLYMQCCLEISNSNLILSHSFLRKFRCQVALSRGNLIWDWTNVQLGTTTEMLQLRWAWSQAHWGSQALQEPKGWIHPRSITCSEWDPLSIHNCMKSEFFHPLLSSPKKGCGQMVSLLSPFFGAWNNHLWGFKASGYRDSNRRSFDNSRCLGAETGTRSSKTGRGTPVAIPKLLILRSMEIDQITSEKDRIGVFFSYPFIRTTISAIQLVWTSAAPVERLCHEGIGILYDSRLPSTFNDAAATTENPQEIGSNHGWS